MSLVILWPSLSQHQHFNICWYLCFFLEYLNTYQLNVIKCGTDIHGPQGLKPIDFSDPLTFTLSTPAHKYLSYLAKCLNTYQIKATEFVQTFMVPGDET